MKGKEIKRICISLMIAIAFILPAGAVMAGSSFGIKEAGDTHNYVTTSNEIRLPGSDPIAQQGSPINFGGFFLEYPNDEFPPMGDDIDDGDTIPLEEYYIPWLTMIKEDPIPAVVKPHMEIYKLTDGVEVIMYETSFEDNYDIYNNWVQIDQDCGIYQGYFDTWSWSDARASDGDHSFKSTMYDIYKGNQDDYLECRYPFDVSDQDAVVVYFDVWAEGQYDDYRERNPFDYASFEIGDGTGLWITNLSLDEDGNEYKFFDTTLPLLDSYWDISENVEDIGNGWWRVKYRANMAVLNALGLDVTDLRFRFDWHSDPQFQYEGAYIDNFKVISIESEMEKIYQGHSQGPYDMIHCVENFEFPLKWYPEEGCYQAILWLEVLDIEHESTFDWPGVEIDFCVSDDLDCEIVDLYIEDSFTEAIVEDGGIMAEGSDAHIVYTYHQGGTIPAENIVIKATATKFAWETLWETDCEGMFPFPDKVGAVHSTDRDAFSGSQSIGWFDKDTYEYPTDAFWYAYGPKVSFEGVEEMYMDVYWKGVTDPGDALYPSFLDSFNGYVLGSGFGDAHGNKMGGYNPTWTGPTENGGKYTRTDLVAMHNHYTDAGFLQDVDGLFDDVPVGFFFSTDGDGENTHPDAVADGIYWSGIFVDDIIITTKKLGEEVWTETMIIPGPLEPCDTHTAQFEWEDVPFSNYLICVEAMCEGDVDPDDNKMCQKILVLDYLEHATLKEVESIDYTGDCQDDWGICSSDYDNYLSTNPDSETYASASNAIAELCPDGEACIDITGLDIHDPAPLVHTFINEDFSGGVPPTGWVDPSGTEWYSYNGNMAGGVAPEADVSIISLFDSSAVLRSSSFNAGMVSDMQLDFKHICNWNSGSFVIAVDAYDGSSWTNDVWSQTVTADIGATPVSVDLTPYISSNSYIRFQIHSHTPGDLQYWHIDDVIVTGTQYFTAPDDLTVEFDAWWDLEKDFDYVYLEVHDGCPALLNENWVEVCDWTNNSFAIGDDDGWYHEVIDLEPYVTGTEFELRFRLDSDANTEGRGFIIDDLIINDNVFGPDTMDDMDNWCMGCYSLGDYWTDWCIDIPDLLIDNALIWDTEINDAYEAYLVVNHTYEFSNQIPILDEWSDLAFDDWTALANYTHKEYTPGGLIWSLAFGPGYGNLVYWAMMGAGDFYHCGLRTIPFDLTTIPLGLECTVEVNQNGGGGGPGADTLFRALSYNAGGTLTGEVVLADFADWGSIGDDTYKFDPYALANPENVTLESYVDWPNGGVANLWQMFGMEIFGATEPATGYIEISADGGDSWQIIDTFIGTTFGADVEDVYDITSWAGNDILVRFRVEGSTDSVAPRFWCINDLAISGKTDTNAPTTTATMSGTMTDAGWYSSAVQVQITAVDDTGMGEIHYILDGSEKIVSGDSASFTVSANGAHNIEFWGVDAMGNEEAPHNIIPTFRIDAGAPPTVAITAPEPGLYLFGNKLLSSSKVFIIGAFNIEATASDAESGVYRVQFYLDGDLISEDTEVPYSAYCAVKHMGAGTIKAVAEDFSGNTAEDTLDITYYKFL